MITMVNTFPGFDVIEVNEPANYLLDELYNDKNKRQLAKTFNAVRKYLNEEKIQEAMSLYVSAANDVVKAKHLDCVDITKMFLVMMIMLNGHMIMRNSMLKQVFLSWMR